MPVTKSAAKRVRTSEKARKSNASIRSRITSARRQTLEALSSNDRDLGDKKFREYCSVLDKAVKKGVIKRNTSIRRKNRAASALAAMPAGAEKAKPPAQAQT